MVIRMSTEKIKRRLWTMTLVGHNTKMTDLGTLVVLVMSLTVGDEDRLHLVMMMIPFRSVHASFSMQLAHAMYI